MYIFLNNLKKKSEDDSSNEVVLKADKVYGGIWECMGAWLTN